MNGDLGKIYEAVTEIRTQVAVLEERQHNNHLENQQAIDDVKNRICNCNWQGTEERVNQHGRLISLLMVTILGALIKMFFIP